MIQSDASVCLWIAFGCYFNEADVSSIKAIINLAMAEHGIEERNPFSSIYTPEEIREER